jgi:hypothetical protein
MGPVEDARPQPNTGTCGCRATVIVSLMQRDHLNKQTKNAKDLLRDACFSLRA